MDPGRTDGYNDRMYRRIWLCCAIVATLAGCASDTPAPLLDRAIGRPNIVILAIDTLRADHLGAYGNPGIRTPHLDAFAAEAVVFEDAASTSTWTLPSFASLFTGLEPQHHATLGGDHSFLPEEIPTLAQILRARGYHTSSLVAVDYLGEAFGMNRGFVYFDKWVTQQVSTRSRAYRGEVQALISFPPPRPWLAFVHYFDTHDPYRPPQPFDRMYYEGDPTVLPSDPARDLGVIHSPTNRIGIRDTQQRYAWLSDIADLDFPVAQYAAGVSFIDDHLGNVLERMRRKGTLDTSIVVILADHGEHLTEHDVYFTHRLPYSECLQVPLMIRLPGAAQAGRRVSDPVSLIDVLPTLMELVGEELETPTDGRSLVPAMRGDAIPERLLFAEYGTAPHAWAKSVWDGDFRYTEIQLGDTFTAELFDRHRDPAETADLASLDPQRTEFYRRALDDHFGQPRRFLDRDADPTAREIDPEVRARLQALGYIE